MTSEFGVILVATDFAIESDQAFRIACSVAKEQCGRLVVLHVIPPSPQVDADADPCLVNEDWLAVRHCRMQFDRLRKLAEGIPLTCRVVVGYAVGMILNTAREERANLIVIASHQCSHFSFQLHGPVSEGVLRQANCPVLCLRQPDSSLNRISIRQSENTETLT